VVDVLFSQPFGCGAVVPSGVRSGEVGVFFCCFVFDFVVVGANRRFPKLWPVGMADVDGSPVELCFIARSIRLGCVFFDRSFSLVVADFPWFR
jgi:hypothetical protein